MLNIKFTRLLRQPAQLSGQRGMALFISLVLLLVLTIAGVSSVQTTSLEQRMARNTHDSVLAFQSAESALREAEQALAAADPDPTTIPTGGAGGYWPVSPFGVLPHWADPTVWTGAGSVVVTNTIAGVESQARYIIEYVATIEQSNARNEVGRGYGSNIPPEFINIYRITALGVGGSDSARVFLQSTFGLIDFDA